MLRKILRRGIRHGRLLGQEQPFLFEMVYAVRDLMQGAYPELADSAARVAKVVEAEEKQFARVMEAGLQNLEKEFAPYVAANKEYGAIRQSAEKIKHLESAGQKGTEEYKSESDYYQKKVREFSEQENVDNDLTGLHPPRFPGDKAFHLYETYGLPIDFMLDAARDAGIGLDMPAFEAARAEEQARARASWKGGSQKSASPAFRELPKTDFLGYKQLIAPSAEVLAIVKDGVGVPAAKAGDLVDVVLDQTSFYGDSGGQVGDTGWFTSADGNTNVAEIEGCVLPVRLRAHRALLKQDLAVGDHVRTVVDGGRGMRFGGIIRERICFMQLCAKCWARM